MLDHSGLLPTTVKVCSDCLQRVNQYNQNAPQNRIHNQTCSFELHWYKSHLGPELSCGILWWLSRSWLCPFPRRCLAGPQSSRTPTLCLRRCRACSPTSHSWRCWRRDSKQIGAEWPAWRSIVILPRRSAAAAAPNWCISQISSCNRSTGTAEWGLFKWSSRAYSIVRFIFGKHIIWENFFCRSFLRSFLAKMGKGIPTFGSQVFSCLIYLTMLRSSHPLWNYSSSSPYVDIMTEPGNKSREGRWTEHTFLSWHLLFGYWNKSTCIIPLWSIP